MKDRHLRVKTPLAGLAAFVTLLALVGPAVGADLNLSKNTSVTITHEGVSPGSCPASLNPASEPCDFFQVNIPFTANKHTGDIDSDIFGKVALVFGSDCNTGDQVFEVDFPPGVLVPNSAGQAAFTGVIPATDFATLHGPVNVFVTASLSTTHTGPKHSGTSAGVLKVQGEGSFATLTSGTVGVSINTTDADADTDTNCVTVTGHFKGLNF